ncbi:MAG: alpha/beta hydrolase [Pseudomonadota bacterium]
MATFTTSDGVSIYFDISGSGPPLLCLAGLTRNSTDFDYAMPSLEGAQVIRMDYRGRGKSAWSNWTSYTIPREAQDALELLHHLDTGKAAILGTSRGGLIAMLIAATAGQHLAGACLVDIGPELEQAGLDVIGGYIGRNPSQKTYGEAIAMRAELLPGFVDVPGSRWDEEVRKHYIETPQGLKINYDPALRESVESAGTQPLPDLWPLFDALKPVPLALIRGANSNLLSEATAEEMRRRRPDMLYANVPDRAHVPFLDEPDAVAILKSFIRNLH